VEGGDETSVFLLSTLRVVAVLVDGSGVCAAHGRRSVAARIEDRTVVKIVFTLSSQQFNPQLILKLAIPRNRQDYLSSLDDSVHADLGHENWNMRL
jgi:hypothetical protein